jgi:hypothetical protein
MRPLPRIAISAARRLVRPWAHLEAIAMPVMSALYTSRPFHHHNLYFSLKSPISDVFHRKLLVISHFGKCRRI